MTTPTVHTSTTTPSQTASSTATTDLQDQAQPNWARRHLVFLIQAGAAIGLAIALMAGEGAGLTAYGYDVYMTVFVTLYGVVIMAYPFFKARKMRQHYKLRIGIILGSLGFSLLVFPFWVRTGTGAFWATGAPLVFMFAAIILHGLAARWLAHYPATTAEDELLQQDMKRLPGLEQDVIEMERKHSKKAAKQGSKAKAETDAQVKYDALNAKSTAQTEAKEKAEEAFNGSDVLKDKNDLDRKIAKNKEDQTNLVEVITKLTRSYETEKNVALKKKLHDDLSEAENELDELRIALKGPEAKIADNKAEQAESTKKLADLVSRHDAETNPTLKKQLQQELAEAEEELNTLVDELAALQAIKGLQAQLEEAEETLEKSTVKTGLDEAIKLSKEADLARDEAKTEVDKAREKATSADSAWKTEGAALDTLKAEVEAIKVRDVAAQKAAATLWRDVLVAAGFLVLAFGLYPTGYLWVYMNNG